MIMWCYLYIIFLNMFLLSMFIVVPVLHLSCFSKTFIWESCTEIWLSLVHVHIWKGVLWWYGPMYMLCSSTCSCWVFLVMFLLLFYLLFLFLFLFSPVFIQELRYESCTCWGLEMACPRSAMFLIWTTMSCSCSCSCCWCYCFCVVFIWGSRYAWIYFASSCCWKGVCLT